jgi:hypothetical protein
MMTMGCQTKVFGNDEFPLADVFDLLIDLGCSLGNGEFAFAFRTAIEFDLDGLVDLVVGEGLALMLFVTGWSWEVALPRLPQIRACGITALGSSQH